MDAARIGIVFDCDGTLLDTMDVWRKLEANLAERANATLTQKDIDKLTTLTIPECGTYFHEHFDLGKSGEDVEGMIAEFMLDYYRTQVEARPGALEFVRELAQQGVRMSVASSSPVSFLEAGLGRCGFVPYLSGIVSVDMVGKSKREPAVWDHARELMGTPLESTWGMEDSVYALNTLSKAGYRTLAIYDCDLSGTFEQLAKSAEHAVRTFEELDATTFISWN